MKARILGRAGAVAAVALLAGAGCTSGGNTITSARCPCTMELVSGDNQEGAPGQALSQELIVKISDNNGVGVLGALVIWQVTSGGGSIEPDCIPQTCPNGGTDPSGLNRARWTLGSDATTQTVQVTTLVAAEEITFTASIPTP